MAEIVHLESERPKWFLAAMAPLALSKEVRKDLGYPINDSQEMHWLVIREGGAVIAFAQVEIAGNAARCGWTWVDREHRRNRLWSEIVEARERLLRSLGCRSSTTCTRHPYIAKALRRIGYKSTRVSGQWIHMRREYA